MNPFLEPKFIEDGEINYGKYKQLAEENKSFWILSFELGYEVVSKMTMDEFLEAEQAHRLLYKQ